MSGGIVDICIVWGNETVIHTECMDIKLEKPNLVHVVYTSAPLSRRWPTTSFRPEEHAQCRAVRLLESLRCARSGSLCSSPCSSSKLPL